MKRKGIILVIYIAVMAILSVSISLFFHEAGHAFFAFVVKAPILKMKVGIESSYVMLDSVELTDMQYAFITIGSFVIPEVIYLILLISNNLYVAIFRVLTGLTNYVNIIFSIVVLITGSKEPETWDILLFKEFSGANSIIIIIVLLTILVINLVCETKKTWMKELYDTI